MYEEEVRETKSDQISNHFVTLAVAHLTWIAIDIGF